MAENLLDLWPSDLGIANLPQSPVSILRQQASALSAKLDNRILARVDSRPSGGYIAAHNFERALCHRLVLVVPSLEDYTLDFLNLTQGEEAYPIVAQLKAKDSVLLKNEEALVLWLREAFASETTRNTLSSLLSLVQ